MPLSVGIAVSCPPTTESLVCSRSSAVIWIPAYSQTDLHIEAVWYRENTCLVLVFQVKILFLYVRNQLFLARVAKALNLCFFQLPLVSNSLFSLNFWYLFYIFFHFWSKKVERPSMIIFSLFIAALEFTILLFLACVD